MSTFGLTTQGANTAASNDQGGGVRTFPMTRFQAPDYGVVTSISFWVNAVSGTCDFSGAIWYRSGDENNPYVVFIDDDTGSATGINTTPQLVTVTMNNIPISAGTWYNLSICGSADFNYYYDSGGSLGQSYPQYATTFRNYLSDDTGTGTNTDIYSVYATYTPRAADNSTYRTISGLSVISGLTTISY